MIGGTVPSVPDTSRFTWSPSQRRVLLILLTVFLAFLIARYAFNTMYVSDPQPEVPPRYDELADRIDPNTADWQTFSVLPGIGEKRAKDIVAYRDRVRAGDPSRVVFDAPGDLLYVKGIGPALISGIEPYLLFPPPRQATRRSTTAPGL